jgi:hypothetical protein
MLGAVGSPADREDAGDRQVEMNEQRHEERRDERGAGHVAPIFQLLGDGRLGSEAVHAVMALLEAEGLPDVAAARIERADLIARRPRPVVPEAADGGLVVPLRRLLASLIVDRGPMTVAAGIRGTALTGCRLLFAADGYEIVVQEAMDTRRRGRSLLGQILQDGDPVEGAAIVLVGADARSQAEADCEGSFRFHNVTSGSYTLDVRADGDLIVCSPITLDEPAASATHP